MNDARLQRYIQIIQALLSSDAGEAETLLAQQEEGVDEQLLQVMGQLAENAAAEGSEELAARLQELAAEVTRFIANRGENASPDSEAEVYRQLARELLQLERESNSDTAVVYPFLDQHRDKLNPRFKEAFLEVSRLLLSDAEQADTFAGIIENTCIHINVFPRGSRADCLEIAIAGYQLVLTVRPRERKPAKWAQTQNNLASAYLYRIRGERGENLERAIAA
ncbi:hypothetical protein, partial [Phormidium sp. CCY1219]|uniref:hypothetical protein n=1 Tax=Phormidium sp. CCY1219 TaxID=2886104 RepID=UPI002D1F65D5|nr:hypothetical protein [Phormidium sp. CCY1219]